MIQPRLFLCSGVSLPADDLLRVGRRTIDLSTRGNDANVHIRLMDLARVFDQHLSPRLEDALEIAAYVYAADCATQRGGAWANDNTTEPWKRDMRFVIPVRDLAFWDRSDVKQLLAQTLRFLSDDMFWFEFRQDMRASVRQEYLEFGADKDWPFQGVDRVLMFSGGLDSLAGAAETAAAGGKLVLVSHRPVSTQSRRQQRLFDLVRSTWNVPMIHVPVWINKDESLGKEPTQRTRSFLYATLGVAVAASVQAEGVRFFENGVVSLNLPVADEVIGARASRTTHPHTLNLLRQFFGLLLDRTLAVDNPYLFKTKKQVVETLAINGGCPLIGYSCSCAHQGIFQSRTRWHCGMCSQCIDRRIAILAAGVAEHEPAEDYVCDVFTGGRTRPEDRNMAVNYARHAMELCRMSEEEMATKFNQHLTRAVRGMPNQAEVARQLVAMHRRHGETVSEVLQQQVTIHAKSLVERTIDNTSMLALVASGLHQVHPPNTGEGVRTGDPESVSEPAARQGEKKVDSPPEEQEELKGYKVEDQPWWKPLPARKEVKEDELTPLADGIDIVIVTATEVERDAVLACLSPPPPRRKVLTGFIGPETYFLGRFGAFNAVVTKCRMGSLGPGSASLAAAEAQRVWRPGR